jgi:hypothetical protein
MKPRNNLWVYLCLVAVWVVLLVLQRSAHLYLPQGNILIYAADSLAPIPIIVLVVVFLVGLFMETREQKSRKQQLMFIKSCMFRLEMRNLYIADFLALASPSITFDKIRQSSLEELKEMRRQAADVEYKSLEAMETVIMEYVKAEDVWRSFMNIAVENRFDAIFQDMLYIVHFIGDVKTYKDIHPDELFIYEASRNEALMQKVTKVLGDGIRKYLEYVIELKEKEPALFEQLIADYELLARTRS